MNALYKADVLRPVHLEESAEVNLRLPQSATELEPFLVADTVIDFNHGAVAATHQRITQSAPDAVDAARRVFFFVRDEVRHSMDAGDDIATCLASDVLQHRTGLCYAKAHLAAAMMRLSGIPAGFVYQRIARGDGLVLHGLLAVYLEGGWHRLDVRGEKPGVHSDFGLHNEVLAYCGADVYDIPALLDRPASIIVSTLQLSSSLRQVTLPSSL